MKWFVLFMLLPAWGLTLANDSPQALQESFLAALLANDADGLAICYAEDATNFPVDRLVGIGPDSVRADWGRFFADFRVTDVQLSDEHREILGDTSVAWGLFTIMAEPVGGGELVEMQGRYMDVSRNIGGKWLYVADHASMPLPAPEE